MIEDPQPGETVLRLTSNCITYPVEILENLRGVSRVKSNAGEIWAVLDELFRKDDFEGLAVELHRRQQTIKDELIKNAERKKIHHIKSMTCNPNT
jgi:hypothetical protein